MVLALSLSAYGMAASKYEYVNADSNIYEIIVHLNNFNKFMGIHIN